MSRFRLADHRLDVAVVVVFVASAALTLQFGGRPLGWISFVGSAWGFITSYGLATGAVVPGPRSGYSPTGIFLIAVGLLGMGASNLLLLQDSTISDWVVLAMMLGLIPGILLDGRARRRSEGRT